MLQNAWDKVEIYSTFFSQLFYLEEQKESIIKLLNSIENIFSIHFSVFVERPEFRETDERPIKIFFQDESRYGRICQIVKSWVPEGIRSEIPKQIVRDFIYAYSAVCPWDGENFSLVYPHVDTDTMKSFMKYFSEYYRNYRNIIIMDRASWHNDKAVNEFSNVRVIRQPASSPELNPVENFWKHIKENHFRNEFWNSLDDVTDKLCEVLKNLIEDKNTVKSLTGFHWILSHVW